MMKGFVATYFASPQGQETIHSYLSSAGAGNDQKIPYYPGGSADGTVVASSYA